MLFCLFLFHAVISLSRLGSREFSTEEAPETTVDEEELDVTPVKSKKFPRGRGAKADPQQDQQWDEDSSRLDEPNPESTEKPLLDTSVESTTEPLPESSELDSLTTDIGKSPPRRGRPARRKLKGTPGEESDNLSSPGQSDNVDTTHLTKNAEEFNNLKDTNANLESVENSDPQGFGASLRPGRQVARKGRGRGARKVLRDRRPGLCSEKETPTQEGTESTETLKDIVEPGVTENKQKDSGSTLPVKTERNEELTLKDPVEPDIKPQNLTSQNDSQGSTENIHTVEDNCGSNTAHQTTESSDTSVQSESVNPLEAKTPNKPKGRRGRKPAAEKPSIAETCENIPVDNELPIAKAKRGRKKLVSESEASEKVAAPEVPKSHSGAGRQNAASDESAVAGTDKAEGSSVSEKHVTPEEQKDTNRTTDPSLNISESQSNQIALIRKRVGAVTRLSESQDSETGVEAPVSQSRRKGKLGRPPTAEPGVSDQAAPTATPQIQARRSRPAGERQLTETLTKAARKQAVCNSPPDPCPVLDRSVPLQGSVEGEAPTLSYDHQSVQDEIKKVDTSKVAGEAAEVVTVTKPGRKRGRQCTNTGRESSTEPPQHKEDKVPAASSEPAPQQQRVKTKAQLKQKPSELSNKEASSPSAQQEVSDLLGTEVALESERYHQDADGRGQAKTSAKKHTKPKTLARIWRSRKRRLFTPRKQKSKAKVVAELAAREADLNDTDINPQLPSHKTGPLERNPPEIGTETLRVKDTKKSDEDVQEVDDSQQKKSPKKAIFRKRSNVSEDATPDHIATQSNNITEPAQEKTVIDNSKLPQKKRHTAKLAAEKERAQREKEGLGVTSCAGTESGRDLPGDGVAPQINTEVKHQTSPRPLEQLTPPPHLELEAGGETEKAQVVGQAEVNGLPVPQPPQLELFTEPSVEDQSLDLAIPNEENESCEIGLAEVSTPRSAEVIRQLMRIATGPKTEDPTSPISQRQGKRAYKREFKVQCHFCQVKVKDYGYLFRHVKKLHRNKGAEMQRHLEEIRPLMRTPCPICHKMVSSISNISSHIKQCHASKDSQVLCPICKKTYKTTVSLRQHLRQCHQPQQQRFFCSLCSANFTEKRSLKEHINCSHETTQVFQCDECGKSFLTKGRLRRHKYIHGEFRHKCSYCSKGFHLKDNMNKHIEIVHEKIQGKRFGCPHCDKRFTVKGNMTQHVMGVHLKQFQYTCPQCQTGFRRKKDMLTHMIKHGGGAVDVELGSDSSSLAPGSINGQTSSCNKTDIDSDGSWQGQDMLAMTSISSDTKPDTVNINVQQLELLLPAPTGSNN